MPPYHEGDDRFKSSLSTNGPLVKLVITPALHAGVLSSNLSWSTSFFMFRTYELKEQIVRPSFYGLEVKETLR